jgi:hypothetical protein
VRAIAVLMIVVVPTLAQAERRCGWYHNPTPANVILEDADGQWWISQQGRAPTQGFLEAYTTAFDDRVRFNVSGQADRAMATAALAWMACSTRMPRSMKM